MTSVLISWTRRHPALLVASCLFYAAAGPVEPQQRVGAAVAAQLPRVLLSTAYGYIEVEVDTVRAPTTGANFLRYVDRGLYDGGQFDRAVRMDNQPNDSIRIEVIAANGDPDRIGEGFPPIPLERTNLTGIRHRDGTVSMSRGGPNTAQSRFFICIGDQPALDYGGWRNPDGQGFAAFARVVAGMDVVRAIHSARSEGQRLARAIRIREVRRVGRAALGRAGEEGFEMVLDDGVEGRGGGVARSVDGLRRRAG